MPYLNIDDGMDEHEKVEALSDAAFRNLFDELLGWSRSGERPTSPLTHELIKGKLVRRAPRRWLPEAVRPRLRHRDRISLEVRSTIYARDAHRCVTCGATDDLTLDHIVPWSLGGSDDESNLQTLCRSCNSRKGART